MPPTTRRQSRLGSVGAVLVSELLRREGVGEKEDVGLDVSPPMPAGPAFPDGDVMKEIGEVDVRVGNLGDSSPIENIRPVKVDSPAELRWEKEGEEEGGIEIKSSGHPHEQEIIEGLHRRESEDEGTFTHYYPPTPSPSATEAKPSAGWLMRIWF